MTVHSALTIIGITVIFMYYSFFISLVKSKYLFIFLLFLFSLCRSLGQQNTSFFFLVDYHKVWSSDRGYVIRLYLKIPEIFCVSFSRMDSGLCIYHLVICLNFNLLHSSHSITFPTQSYALLELLFCIRLLSD